MVRYTYDAWGNILSVTGTRADNLGKYNPLRYRGYIYDRETGLYYLQSRYYDPQWGRFLNADVYISTGQGLLSNNMFAYCNNNPINYCDRTGCTPEYNGDPMYEWAWDLGCWIKEKIEDAKEKHYSRNQNNKQMPEEYNQDFFEEWDDSVAANCHQFTSPDRSNRKYVSPDGKYEAIYDKDDNLVTDCRDVGTYNYCSPNTDPLGHVINDVIPWIIWGNSQDDTTKWYDRLLSCVNIYLS